MHIDPILPPLVTMAVAVVLVINGRCFEIGNTMVAALNRFGKTSDAHTSGDLSQHAWRPEYNRPDSLVRCNKGPAHAASH